MMRPRGSSRATPGTKLPNFFVAGVPKAGTTSLYAYLRQHPRVFMSPVKEPMFFGARDLLSGPVREQFLRYLGRNPVHLRNFLEDTEQRRARRYLLDWDDYVRLFEHADGESAIGEASVDYFWLPSAAAAIHDVVPDAKLLFVLRHPADKLLSSFYVARRRQPDLAFRAWFEAATLPGAPSWPLVDGARYATHLERFFRVFPRHQIRIYLYDAFRTDPTAMLRDVFSFLGAEPHDFPIDTSQRHNEGVVPRWPRLHGWRRRLLGDARPTRLVPERIRERVFRLYYRSRADTIMRPEDRARVIDYYRTEIARTEALLAQDLSSWLS